MPPSSFEKHASPCSQSFHRCGHVRIFPRQRVLSVRKQSRTLSTLRKGASMAKATTTIKQVLHYQDAHAAWFAANQVLFNQVAAFYFEVIQAHERVLDLSNKEALRALEKLTHTTKKNPTPAMPLEDIGEDIPALFRRAAIHAALGSARSHGMRNEISSSKGERERPPVIRCGQTSHRSFPNSGNDADR